MKKIQWQEKEKFGEDKVFANIVRNNRGNGPRQHVKPQTKIVSWKSFLLNSENKNDLFRFLAEQVINFKYFF